MELTVEYAGASGPRAVGRLYQDPRGTVYFEYDAAWRTGGRELSPLHLPNATAGAVVTPTPVFSELHGLFEDALPDWWGRRMMRQRFAEAGIPWHKVTALRKLACQGERKMGALVFRPVLEEGDFNDHLLVELSALVESARQAMTSDTAELLRELVRSGMSPGGARPKALLAFSADFRQVHIDEPPPAGFEPWMVKFDLEPDLHEGRVEHAYALMAAAAGIEVAETRLIESAGGCHFATRRFDRTRDGVRRHLHSFSGLTHTPVRDGLEYGELMELARMLTGDQRAVEEVFRRAVFNVAAGNEDDHGRNHAFLMEDDGAWRLSPAYDLTCVGNALASGFRAARVNGRAAEIRRADLMKLGAMHDVRRVAETIDRVLAAIADWPAFAREAGIPAATVDYVAGNMPGLG
ncbi:type II toxin-antitoxin system HipA family toxin [Luteolibacter sp. LG18]|uniref:type II toxin-antitoxin system HipA family toxin n=1 Tax=Luteolibacter sp. LG18 TaxID=2819286 RepID=UPI002B31642B|nr:toxin HipA [Luteolibacter sp. LG18]